MDPKASDYVLSSRDPFAPGGYLLKWRWGSEPTATPAELTAIGMVLAAQAEARRTVSRSRYERVNGVTIDNGHGKSAEPGKQCCGLTPYTLPKEPTAQPDPYTSLPDGEGVPWSQSL